MHWKLSTHSVDEPLFAWDFLINQWQSPELSRSAVLQAFRRAADKEARPPSDVTLEQHFGTFLHTYVPTLSWKGEIQEDNLDCPLVELEFITLVGERRIDGTGIGKRRREHGSGLGKLRWYVERTIACLHAFGRLRRRLDRLTEIQDAFLRLACALICLRLLVT